MEPVSITSSIRGDLFIFISEHEDLFPRVQKNEKVSPLDSMVMK